MKWRHGTNIFTIPKMQTICMRSAFELNHPEIPTHVLCGVSKLNFAAVYFKGLWSLCHFATFIIWQFLIAATFRAESWVYLECNNDNCSQLLINSCANYFWAKIFLTCFILVKVSRLHSLWASAEQQQSILSNTLFKL